MKITILVADDHALFRSGIRRILEESARFSIIGEAGSGFEAVELAREHRPDVAIVDISMGEIGGIAATSQILRVSPRTAVLMLTMHSDPRFVLRAVKAGARGYILKDSVEDSLIRAVELAHEGQAYFSPEVLRVIRGKGARDLEKAFADDPYHRLTDRERQVYSLLAEAKGSKEIAARLWISVHTVETHRARIMGKLHVHGIAELVLSAVRRGLVS